MGFFDKIKKFKKMMTLVQAKPKQAEAPTAVKGEEIRAVIKPAEAGRKAAYRVLLQPLVSEKTANAETKGTYTFVVGSSATKTDVKEAIKLVYGVKPVAVRTINREGKRVRFGRNFGKRKDWKKAIVTLPKGKTISIHEGV